SWRRAAGGYGPWPDGAGAISGRSRRAALPWTRRATCGPPPPVSRRPRWAAVAGRSILTRSVRQAPRAAALVEPKPQAQARAAVQRPHAVAARRRPRVRPTRTG